MKNAQTKNDSGSFYLSPILLDFLVQRHFLAVEKHAMPQFQGDQRKDLFGVGTGIAVGTNKLFNGGLLKVSSLDRLSVGQNVANLILEIVSQPKFVWNGKTSFFRFRMLVGTRFDKAFFQMYFKANPFSLKLAGRDAANSRSR